MRLEEKNWSKESWQEEEELWPREFCLGEQLWAGALRALGWEPRGLGQMAENFKALKKEDQISRQGLLST